MLDALSALVITFIVMSVISVVGLTVLYLVKHEIAKKVVFYALALWGLVVGYCNVLSASALWGWDFTACIWGLLSVAALLVHWFWKKKKSFDIARILATVSVVAGMVDCFVIV